MILNVVKTGFFVFLKGQKSYSAFANFCYSFYKDDFYIFISARPLKVGLIRFNVLKKVIPKPGFHRSKDRQRSEVLEGVTIRKDGFKDLSFWESIERGLRVPEDRPCVPVES